VTIDKRLLLLFILVGCLRQRKRQQEKLSIVFSKKQNDIATRTGQQAQE
jgi:hypothetical protein